MLGDSLDDGSLACTSRTSDGHNAVLLIQAYVYSFLLQGIELHSFLM
jgi:hypothetical protein